MSIDFRPALPPQERESEVGGESDPEERGAPSFAGRLQGVLTPSTPSPRVGISHERTRRSPTPALGVDRSWNATRSVPNVDVAQVAPVPLPAANVPCAPRFDGVAALLSHPVRLSLSSDAEDRAPPRDRAPHPRADGEADVAEADAAEAVPARAQRADAAVSQSMAAQASCPIVPSEARTVAASGGFKRVSLADAAGEGPGAHLLAARLAKALGARAKLDAQSAAAPSPSAPSSAAPSPSSTRALHEHPPRIARPASEKLAPAVPALPASPSRPAAAAPPVEPRRASAPPDPSSPALVSGLGQAPLTPSPSVAMAPAPNSAPLQKYAHTELPDPVAPDVRWRAGEARVSMKTDAGELSLHVRVKDGLTDVAAAGPGAKHLKQAGGQLQAHLSKEGLVLGRFAAQATLHVASLDDGPDPFARQDPDEEDGTASAEGDEERLISGKGRSRSSRRLHVKA